MKFSCEKETLLNLLSIASRAVTGKSSMPLLEGLLLAADADTLTITGYDLSMGIRTTAQVDVVEPGRIVLNARLILDIVPKAAAGRRLPRNRRQADDHHQVRPFGVQPDGERSR